MDCIECARKIEKAVLDIDGVQRVRISYTMGKLDVEADRDVSAAITHTLERLGYGVGKGEIGYEEFFTLTNRRLMTTVIAGVFFALGLVSDLVLHQPALFYTFYALTLVVSGYYIARRGIASIYERYLDMNVLMLIAVAGAVLISAFEEAASIVFLFSVAEMLESYSVAKTRRSISELIDFAPKRAQVRRGGQEINVDVRDVELGDIAIIRPGERVSMDGEIVEGGSSVDESPVTGESVPMVKTVGDLVFGGTLNGSGYLEVKVTKHFEDMVIQKIVQLVEEAETNKAPTQRFIDRFARVYTPIVITMAMLTMVVPTLLFGAPFVEWFYRGLVLLVISCPCALVISTPVSVVSAISGGARRGVLFKGGLFLERMGQIRVVAFDKTGTLTEGRPRVEEIVSFNGCSEREVLKIAASAENRSEHHLARAILNKAMEEKVPVEEVRSFQAIHGKGISVVILERRILAGSPALFREMNVDLSKYERMIDERSASGRTVILVGAEDELMGMLTISDQPRAEAKEVVDGLKAMGIKVVMLTGDDQRVAERIASRLGIEEYRARLLPKDKVQAVDEFQAKYGPILMVGDGVNDAPALAKAEVGVAMGVAGTDVALEASDIALMGDDLRALLYGIRLSRRSATVIRENVVVSLTAKLLLAALTFPGLVTLWLAILVGDLGLSLVVIANALRLHRTR
jgi:Zn2+/Cd2+-exporting ATPase